MPVVDVRGINLLQIINCILVPIFNPCANNETMNKLISTKNRVPMSMVGPRESGETQLSYEWLTNGIFQLNFDEVYFF